MLNRDLMLIFCEKLCVRVPFVFSRLLGYKNLHYTVFAVSFVGIIAILWEFKPKI